MDAAQARAEQAGQQPPDRSDRRYPSWREQVLVDAGETPHMLAPQA